MKTKEEKMISQGAEAKIFEKGDYIIKERVKKGYRISQIDDKLRKERTKKEHDILLKANNLIKVPKIIGVDNYSLIMEKIDGTVLKEVLNDENYHKLMKEIAKSVSKLHNANIIHGDLTTSNMIFYNNHIYFIDFGLSFYSQKIEDRGVDIHLFKRALESKHHQLEKAFDVFLEEYEKHANKSVLDRLEMVESRGRYKE